MKTESKRNIKVIVILIGCFVVLSGFLLLISGLNLDWLSVRKKVIGTNTVKLEDIQDSDGRFVIIDYPDFDITRYVELGDYRSMLVAAVERPEITEEDIDSNIRSYLYFNEKYEKKTEGEVHMGDTVCLSYTGYYEGEVVEDYDVTDRTLVLREGAAPDTFLDAFDGATIGEEVEFDVFFDDGEADLAAVGKTYHFKGTASYVVVYPELTDETIGEITDGEFETVDAFRESIRNDIAAYDDSIYDATLSDEILSGLVGEAKFKTIPNEFLTWFVAKEMQYYQDMADTYGVSVEEYLQAAGLTTSDMNDLVSVIAQSAPEFLRQYGVLMAVAEAEGITVDPEADAKYIADRYAALMAGFGLENKEAVDAYYRQSNVYRDVLNWKTMDWLKEHVTQVSAADIAANGQ